MPGAGAGQGWVWAGRGWVWAGQGWAWAGRRVGVGGAQWVGGARGEGLSSGRFGQHLGAGTQLQSLPVNRLSPEQTPQNKTK